MPCKQAQGPGQAMASKPVRYTLPPHPPTPPYSYHVGARPPAPRRNFQSHWQVRAAHASRPIKPARGQEAGLPSCFPPPPPPLSHARPCSHLQYACEGQWRLAFFMFMAGMPVFFVNMALAAWIKFSYSTQTAATMTAVMALSLTIFLVAQNRWCVQRGGVQGVPAAAASQPLINLRAAWLLPIHSRRSWHLIGGRRTDLDEALPQPPPAGLPWDWHRRPLGGTSVLVDGRWRTSSSGLDKADAAAAAAAANGGGGDRAAP